MNDISGRSWRAAGWIIAVSVSFFLFLFFLWPVSSMLWRGIADGADGLREVLTTSRTWRITWQTIWMALAGTFFSVLLGIPGAYILYRRDFPGRSLLRAFISIPFVLPTVVAGVAFRSVFSNDGPYSFLGLDQNVWAVVIAMIFFNYALVVRMVGIVWANLDPRLVDAARTLGASPLRAFRTVTLPALTPSIGAAASLVFIFCSTAYGIVQMLGRPGYGTLETEMWVQTVTYLDFSAAAGLAFIQLAIVILALIFQHWVTKRTDRAARVRGYSVRPLNRSDIPSFLLVLVLAIVLIAIPLLALVERAFHSKGTWSLHNFRALLTSGTGFTGGATPLEALGNSIQIALLASLIALAVGVPLSVLLARSSKSGRILDSLVLAPLGVSSVMVGFGFFVTLQAPPLNLREAGLLVPMAQAVVALPMVVRAIVPSLRSIDVRQREAAAVLGAGKWRVLATVDGPYLVRGIVLAAGFAFAISLGEFGATSFLSSPSEPTLPVIIARLLGRPGVDNHGMAMAASVVLGVVSAGVMLVAEMLHNRLGRLLR